MSYSFVVPLIPQINGIGCWAASIRMIFAAAGKGDPIGSGLFPSANAFYTAHAAPSEGRSTDWSSWTSITESWKTKKSGGTGGTPHKSDCSEILKVLKELMLQPVPGQPRIYSAQWLDQSLPDNGPMFVGGNWGPNQSFHAVVIRGVDTSPDPIMINDPWPVGHGGLITSMSISRFNELKEPNLPIHYLPQFYWRSLCIGLPPKLGGPNP